MQRAESAGDTRLCVKASCTETEDQNKNHVTGPVAFPTTCKQGQREQREGKREPGVKEGRKSEKEEEKDEIGDRERQKVYSKKTERGREIMKLERGKLVKRVGRKSKREGENKMGGRRAGEQEMERDERWKEQES